MKTLNSLTIDLETPGIITTVYSEVNIEEPTWNNPCENCPNNPMVNKFASGVCNCILPYINNPIY